MWIYINMQKSSSFHLLILQTQSILEHHHMTGQTHFCPCQCLKFNLLLICLNLYQHARNQLIPWLYSWDRFNFRVQRPDWPYPFLTMPHQKNFNKLLIFVNLYQHAKNETVSLICSTESPAIWLAESILAYISGTKSFSSIGFVQGSSQ